MVLAPARPSIEAPPRPALPVSASPTWPDDAPDAFDILSEVPPRGRGGPFSQSLPSAVEALRANKGRGILTSLGIIIGVAAVIVMVALGQGASAQVSESLAGLGTNVLTIMPGSARSGGVQTGAGSANTLKVADADAIQSEVAGADRVSPVVQGNVQVIVGSQNWSTRVQGVEPEYQQIQSWQMSSGAFFSAQDEQSASSVAVIGQTVWRSLFPDAQNPIGQLIRVRNVPMTIVGVLASKGSNGFQDQDDVIFVPFSTAQIRLFGSTSLGSIQVQSAQADQTDSVTQGITSLLRLRHNLQTNQTSDFTVRSSNDIVQTAQGVSQTLTVLLAGASAVSLFVGGIGIMNIMLASVTERTREIGIRSAIGARPGDILSQFLIEAVLLSSAGGVIGIALGISISWLVSHYAGWATLVSPGSVGIAFGFAAAVGIFFGYYPARQASMLRPIEALRSD